jgi:integrase
MAVLRAALGSVLVAGAPNTEAAWQEPLKPIRNATKRRNIYLDRDQRKALLAHTPADAEPFVRALCLLPLRPGAIAGLTAGDYDKRTREITIGVDKSGEARRILLPVSAAELFAYVLRHSTITDLVNARLPLLTIAQISGTSVEMIQAHYGHLGRDAATEALAGLAL